MSDPTDDLTVDQDIEAWVERANKVSSKLAEFGMPTEVKVKSSGGKVQLAFNLGAIGNIILGEILCERLARETAKLDGDLPEIDPSILLSTGAGEA